MVSQHLFPSPLAHIYNILQPSVVYLKQQQLLACPLSHNLHSTWLYGMGNEAQVYMVSCVDVAYKIMECCVDEQLLYYK
jgi:hypothetical protein